MSGEKCKMKTKYKIILIACISPIIIFYSIFFIGPIVFITVSNAYSGFIISNTSDKVFEEEFAKIPEVAIFIAKYSNYNTYHSEDFLGWKTIMYTTHGPDNKSVITLLVRKNMLHQGTDITVRCDADKDSGIVSDVLQDQVMDFLKNNNCLEN